MEKLKAILTLIMLNWKTSLAGAALIIVTNVALIFKWDIDPQVIVTLIGSIIGVAFILSRDLNVTSEGTTVTEKRLEEGERIEDAQYKLADQMRARSANDLRQTL